jgi:hypothetical protein
MQHPTTLNPASACNMLRAPFKYWTIEFGRLLVGPQEEHRTMKTRTVVIVALAAARLLSAQILPDATGMRALVAARSLKCSFPWYASADWDQDQPQMKSASQKEFGFQIDSIDYRKASARIIGNAGADDLTATQGTSSVSFVERVPIGSLNVTTVYAWRDRTGRFKAVHSRHTAIGGPSPSQNYGFCEVW